MRPDDLAALVLAELMERTGVPPKEVEDVYMGCANQAGEDNRDVARMALLLAGLPVEVGGTTINRLCGSGLDAVAGAARAIMTGHATLYDTTLGWRFVNPRMEALGHTDSLGQTAENLAQERCQVTHDENAPDRVAHEYRVSREAQDRFALGSHQRAMAAIDDKRFREEVSPVPVRTRRTDTVAEVDEGPRRDTSLEQLARLKPAFKQDGSVTAGNSSSLNDGAAAVLLVSDDFARAHNLQPLARIRIMTTAGVPPRVMGIGPVPAPRKALERAGISPDDLGLVELNEAFAAQVLAVLREWKMAPTDERLNPNGGAIALGHPLGCSGWSSRRWPDGRRPVGAVEAGHAVGDGELLRIMRPRPGPARRCRPSPAALGVARRSCRALGAPAWVLSDANGVGWVTTQPNGQPAVREARGCDVDGRIDARSGWGLDYPVSQMAR